MFHVLLHDVVVHVEHFNPNGLDRRHTIKFSLLLGLLALQHLATNEPFPTTLLVQIGVPLFTALVLVEEGRDGIFKGRNPQPIDVELERVLCYKMMLTSKEILTP